MIQSTCEQSLLIFIINLNMFALFVLLLSSVAVEVTAAEKVLELTMENYTRETFETCEYIVINFHDNTMVSYATLNWFIQAGEKFDSNRGELEPSVCWATANLEIYPDLAYGDIGEDALPHQVIFSNQKMKRINFVTIKSEDPDESATRFMNDIQAMTGTYLQEIRCH